MGSFHLILEKRNKAGFSQMNEIVDRHGIIGEKTFWKRKDNAQNKLYDRLTLNIADPNQLLIALARIKYMQ